MTYGSDLIAAERERQITEEGYDAAHDRGQAEALAMAAVSYALPLGHRQAANDPQRVPYEWPWRSEYWKPTPGDREREMVKAGALLAAAIDALRATR